MLGRGLKSLITFLWKKKKYGSLIKIQPDRVSSQLIMDFLLHLPLLKLWLTQALGFLVPLFAGNKGSLTLVLWSILGFPSNAASRMPQSDSYSSLFPISHQELSLKSKHWQVMDNLHFNPIQIWVNGLNMHANILSLFQLRKLLC